MKKDEMYILMKMKFRKGRDYWYGRCGIPENNKNYKPVYVYKFTTTDYMQSLVDVIKLTDRTKGRKYDTMYYIVPANEYYGKSEEEKEKFLDRELQEDYMENFFDTMEYIHALDRSNVLDNLPVKKVLSSIHLKFANVDPIDYIRLGLELVDLDLLNALTDTCVDNIHNHVDLLELEDTANELEQYRHDCDKESLNLAVTMYKNAFINLEKVVKDLNSKIDQETGIYKSAIEKKEK